MAKTSKKTIRITDDDGNIDFNVPPSDDEADAGAETPPHVEHAGANPDDAHTDDESDAVAVDEAYFTDYNDFFNDVIEEDTLDVVTNNTLMEM